MTQQERNRRISEGLRLAWARRKGACPHCGCTWTPNQFCCGWCGKNKTMGRAEARAAKGKKEKVRA
jgi:hypothetical protein